MPLASLSELCLVAERDDRDWRNHNIKERPLGVGRYGWHHDLQKGALVNDEKYIGVLVTKICLITTCRLSRSNHPARLRSRM